MDIKVTFRKMPLVGGLLKKRTEIAERRAEKKKYLAPVKRAKRDKKTAFLVFTPEHANLGDHAIALAEMKMLDDLGIKYYEVTGKVLGLFKRKGWLGAFNKSPVLISGGGYLGTLWFDAEEIVRKILEENPSSEILFFPNTMYYEGSDFGKNEFDKSKIIYNRHRKLSLFARERISFEAMSSAYGRTKLVPDMVLTLNESLPGQKRSGCLICLRNDHEQTLTDDKIGCLTEKVRELFGNDFSHTDTVIDHGIMPDEREAELQKKFDEFRRSELVITDRLHGMIFAAITGTPCVVLDSKSPKVRGCYEWIKDLEYIKFCDNVEDIPAVYKSIPKKEFRYENDKLIPYYEILKDNIKQILGGKK